MSESVGKILKKARESRHLSINDVSERTRIDKKILSAIEEDRLDEISSPFYAKTFVKSYARFLNAEEEKVVKEFLLQICEKETPRLTLERERQDTLWTVFIKYKKKIGLIVLIISGICVFGYSLILVGKVARNIYARYKEYAAKRQEDVKAKMSGVPVEKVGKEKRQVVDNIKLEIQAHSNTWMQVRSDGELLFKGILKKGASDVWKADKKIELVLGNAGGVRLILNGKNLGAPGDKGEKKTIVVTENGIE